MTKRPDFTQAVHALIRHAASALEALAHVDPERVLVVAGEARRASRATVKPMRFRSGKRVDSLGRRKPLVTVHGVPVLYVVTLRPLFFRRSTPRQRVATILHELFHMSRRFDGTLHRGRRHRAGDRFERRFAPLERRYWKKITPEVLAPFAYDGEVRVRMWLEKPQTFVHGERLSTRRAYTEKHLFEGVMRLRSKRRPAPKRTGPKV